MITSLVLPVAELFFTKLEALNILIKKVVPKTCQEKKLRDVQQRAKGTSFCK